MKESRIGMVYYCPMQFALWRKERRIHTCCALVVTSELLVGGFFPQNHNRTIACSTTTLCKALRVIIVFRSKLLAAPCALAFVSNASHFVA